MLLFTCCPVFEEVGAAFLKGTRRGFSSDGVYVAGRLRRVVKVACCQRLVSGIDRYQVRVYRFPFAGRSLCPFVFGLGRLPTVQIFNDGWWALRFYFSCTRGPLDGTCLRRGPLSCKYVITMFRSAPFLFRSNTCDEEVLLAA